MNHTASYSPDDNKLRLYPACRLDAKLYARVKAAGFSWAPKQELFVASMWTPAREDFLIELCGEIGDEDRTLMDRAEDRAERFEDYSDKRLSDAESARKAVAAIADNIPLGQPILVGHHSERHARKDAERIENGMRKAVKMWETSKYWEARAAGAIRHARYKELPGVRHRRIKTLEAEKRKCEKNKQESDMWLKLWKECGNETDTKLQAGVALRLADMCWLRLPRKEGDREDFPHSPSAHDALTNSHPTLYAPRTLAEIVEHAKSVYPATIAVCDRWIAHYDNRLTYERAMLAAAVGMDESAGNAMADRWTIEPGGKVLVERDQWLTVIRVNRARGIVNSITTTAPAGVHWQKTWKYGIEKVRDYQPPTEEQAAKVKKATALPPLCNYPGEGFREMTEAEWKARRKWSDFPYIAVAEATATKGKHRYRQMPKRGGQMWERETVYITDGKRVDPPPPADSSPAAADSPPERERPTMTGYSAPQPRNNGSPEDEAFRAMKEGLKHGVQIVTAPQLFPTPTELAARMVELADIQPGDRVLEPSAGTGALLAPLFNTEGTEWLPGQNGAVLAIEINDTLARALRREYVAAEVRTADFLLCNDLGSFDKVLMNPPFVNGADIKHIEHALTILKPGGRLVAICANGRRQRETLKPIADDWQDLPPGTFSEQGTKVNTALVVFDKLAE